MIDGIFVLGLTGSIGMGKSTTAAFFAEAGLPVWDADAAVHRLYQSGGPAVEPVRAICPEAVGEDGVNREVLKKWIASDETALGKLNAVVHPLVGDDRAAFIRQAAADGAQIVVVDVPLLFETGGDRNVDASLVVTAPPEVQRARVLERPGMTEDHFQTILSRQMPDAEKRARADYIIETTTKEAARAAVAEVIRDINARLKHA